MLLNQSRVLLWFHWVAVSTVGCGTFCLASEVASVANELDPEHRYAVFVVIAVLLCIVVSIAGTLVAQQLILNGVGLSAHFWFPSTFLGLTGGVLAGVALALIFGVLIIEFAPRVEMAYIFCCTAAVVTALAQSAEFPISIQKRAVWAASNGAFACLIAYRGLENVFATFSPLETAMLVGLIYGVFTGTALVWIAPTPSEVLAERRYLSLLARRPLPSKLDWSFSNELGQATSITPAPEPKR